LLGTLECKSRLVALIYEMVERLKPPPVDASEGKVRAALASAFHRKGLVAVGGRTGHAARQVRARVPQNLREPTAPVGAVLNWGQIAAPAS
jgi:hypothetical protein